MQPQNNMNNIGTVAESATGAISARVNSQLTVDISTRQASPASQASHAPQTPADRLETARQRVRFALCCADEDEATFATLDSISRALVAATSELEHVAIELDALANLTNHQRLVS